MIGVTSCLRATDLPADLPGRAALYGEEGILYAEIDTRRAQLARQQFDPVGHYSRPDVFRLVVDTTPQVAVSSRDEAACPPPA